MNDPKEKENNPQTKTGVWPEVRGIEEDSEEEDKEAEISNFENEKEN